MKVFVSHKEEDRSAALLVLETLFDNGIDAYIDVLDDLLVGDGKTLTDHIKNQLNNCSDIIVVISAKTRLSWWVPFEIGMSAQVDMPTASFIQTGVELPSYLTYWPRLRTVSDIEQYVRIRKRVAEVMQSKYGDRDSPSRRRAETEEFYSRLKQVLPRI